jgi:hypothetical protein
MLQYRKLNLTEEQTRFEQIVGPFQLDQDVESTYPNALPHQNRMPTRTQSSVLDNRSTGLQPRSISTGNLLKRFSFRFGRQETELDQLSRPSLPGNFQLSQTFLTSNNLFSPVASTRIAIHFSTRGSASTCQ